MRLNAKIFTIPGDTLPVETQEFDNRLVEVYYINDYPTLFNQYLPKGKFAIWASVDGFNYRLFIEKGYYEELGELYTDRVNKVWLDFWDKCDDVTKKYNFRVMLPIAIVVLGLFLASAVIPMGDAGMWVQLVILLIFLVAMFSINKFIRKKITFINEESVQSIKDIVGSDHFNELLEAQDAYMKKFFDDQAKKAEEEFAAEEAKENNEAVIETEKTNDLEKIESAEPEKLEAVENASEEAAEATETVEAEIVDSAETKENE